MLGRFHEGWLLSRAELKESLTRMGSDLKHGFISSLRTAWQTLNDFARAHTASAQLQAELAIVANQIEEQEKQAQEGERFRKIKKTNNKPQRLLNWERSVSPKMGKLQNPLSFVFDRAQDCGEPRAAARGGASGEGGDAERGEPHRLRPAGEAHREFQRVPLCPPEPPLLLVHTTRISHALHSHPPVRRKEMEGFTPAL